MKYTVVLTEKRDGNVMVAVPVDVGTEPNSENRHFGAPWEWFGTFKDNPTWGENYPDPKFRQDVLPPPGPHFAIDVVQTHCMRLLFEIRNMIETNAIDPGI